MEPFEQMWTRISIWKMLLACFLLGGYLPASGQNPQLETRNGRRFPTVDFSWVRWGANPPYYTIAIDSGGDVTYESVPQSVEKTGAPYTVEFVGSASTRQKIFDLVKRLKLLDIPSSNVQHFRGSNSVKTLVFREGNTQHQIRYQTSRNPLIRQLTAVFQNIGTTLDFGRRLTLLQQTHSRRLSSELKNMQQLARNGSLQELQAVAPVLQRIASDTNVTPGDRKRAEAIIQGT
jgi:hypothetical protein